MSKHLGPLEVECDAPPYAIVHACRKLGMSEPEDVRWCRKGRRFRRHQSWIQFLTSPIWGRLLSSEEEELVCLCGRALPPLESYCFTFRTGDRAEYEMSQCSHCRTIIWEKG